MNGFDMSDDSAYKYRAFGLVIDSDIELSELEAVTGQATPDVTIVLAEWLGTLPDPGQPPIFDYCSPRGIEMIWPGVAAFLIADNSRIEVMPYPDIPRHFLAFPILGPVFGWLLECRGLLVLHASGVVVDGACIAFLGDKLAGKSTTAAAFLRRGARLITDDLLAIELPDSGDAIVRPAFAQLKLADDAATEIAVPGSQPLPLVFDGFPKRQHRLTEMEQRATRLGRLFILERGAQLPGIKPMSPAQAMVALMRFSYSVRFASAPADPEKRARHFQACAAIARQGGVAILEVPARLEALDAVVDLVLQDLGRDLPHG